MRVHAKIASTRVNGPGDRAIIHFQGCQNMGGPGKGCPGCWNPETHNVDESKEVRDIVLLEWIIDNAKDGVTFSGGEPMQQAHSLDTLVYWIKSMRPELSLGMYTGYTGKELEMGKYEFLYAGKYKSAYDHGYNPWPTIKKNLDFAIMGRFNQQAVDKTTSLRSSTNQKLVLFSNRYKESDFEQQAIEFSVNSDGLIQITGFPVGINHLLENREW
jgi:anaerobic ribonucleoside-triphosphate reductase activating protein